MQNQLRFTLYYYYHEVFVEIAFKVIHLKYVCVEYNVFHRTFKVLTFFIPLFLKLLLRFGVIVEPEAFFKIPPEAMQYVKENLTKTYDLIKYFKLDNFRRVSQKAIEYVYFCEHLTDFRCKTRV